MADRGSALFDPYELLGALQARTSVSFVVIGAFARVVRGTRELTDGIDITPSMREENLVRLEAALSDLDARRVDGEPLDLRSLPSPVIELETQRGRAQARPRAGRHARLRRPPPPRRPTNRSAEASAPRSPPPTTSPACSAPSTATTGRGATPPPAPPHEPRAQAQPRTRPRPRPRALTRRLDDPAVQQLLALDSKRDTDAPWVQVRP